MTAQSIIMQRLAQNGEFWLHPVAVALLQLFILAAVFVIIPIEELFLKKSLQESC